MSWRNQKTHREETKAVKEALKKAGISAKVGHGTGTAWSWLEIFTDRTGDREKILEIAQDVTGRSGDYHGNILVN